MGRDVDEPLDEILPRHVVPTALVELEEFLASVKDGVAGRRRHRVSLDAAEDAGLVEADVGMRGILVRLVVLTTPFPSLTLEMKQERSLNGERSLNVCHARR